MIEYTFEDFIDIVGTLLGENGCPWDRSRTFENLREDLLEECYETLDAVDKNDPASLREELGDILLAVALYSKIAEKNGLFTPGEVIDGVAKKIIRRHSHVFGDKKAATPEESLANWEAEKRLEKGEKMRTERLRSVPVTLPALMRAQKTLGRAEGSGFAENNLESRADELLRYAAGLKNGTNAEINASELIGGALFCLADISRFFEINAEFALTNAIETFINVFENAENACIAPFSGKLSSFEEETFNEQD